MGSGEHRWLFPLNCVIRLHRCFVTLLHSGENSRRARPDDDDQFRQQPRREVSWASNNETANGKACQVALKCRFQNANGHITEGGLDGRDLRRVTASLWKAQD